MVHNLHFVDNFWFSDNYLICGIFTFMLQNKMIQGSSELEHFFCQYSVFQSNKYLLNTCNAVSIHQCLN